MNKIYGKRIIIWGCGKYGKELFYPLLERYHCDIVAYTDSNSDVWGMSYRGIKVISVDSINDMEYDYVVITTRQARSVYDIRKKLENKAVPGEKVIDILSDWNYLDIFMEQRFYWIQDYARYVKENRISGSIAECGVLSGNSARFINAFFEDKKFYLFDTFDGFTDEDLEKEISLGNESFNNSQFARNPFRLETDLGFLMTKMKYPENIVIKKGYFPESAEDVKDRFCFVNLDMDLYVPMLNGLRYFWDKMETGGIILLHDYYHPELPGVRKAVKEFEDGLNCCLTKMPIGDTCSIAVIKTN